MEGKKGCHHVAEDALEAVLTRPPQPDSLAFRQDIELALDCLHEVMLAQRGAAR